MISRKFDCLQFQKTDALCQKYDSRVFEFERNAIISFMNMICIFFPCYGTFLCWVSQRWTALRAAELVSTLVFSLITLVFKGSIKHQQGYKSFGQSRTLYMVCVICYAHFIGICFADTSYVVIYVMIFSTAMLYLSPKMHGKIMLILFIIMHIFSNIIFPSSFSIREQFFFIIEESIVIIFTVTCNHIHSRRWFHVFELEQKLIDECNIDMLTGLLNRRKFDEALKSVLHRADCIGCVIIVDLDHFKEVNDSFGHREGDVALQKAANILRNSFREYDCVARIGGDEFAVFFTSNIDEEYIISLLQNKLTRLLKQTPIVIEKDGIKISVTFSIGACAGRLKDKGAIEQLFVGADIAMYQVKRNGKNGACLHVGDSCKEIIIHPK